MKRHDADAADSRALRERLESLALSRARVIGQLSAATEPYHRHVLERALASLDAEAEELKRAAAGPDTGTREGAGPALPDATGSK